VRFCLFYVSLFFLLLFIYLFAFILIENFPLKNIARCYVARRCFVACQNTSFISTTFYKLFTKKVYISNVIILKNEKIFSRKFFLKYADSASDPTKIGPKNVLFMFLLRKCKKNIRTFCNHEV
jgi:hypothetical protein